MWLLLVGTAATTISSTTTTAVCEAAAKDDDFTPSSVAGEDMEALVQSHGDKEDWPVYTSEQVAEKDGRDGQPVWMSYGGVVYDVTRFVPNHPGGSEKILEAAGSAVEPHWYIYRQHFASDLPQRLMEHMAVGRLCDADQDAIDEQMQALEKDDPYAKEPTRSHLLRVHSDTPMNAEVPAALLTQSYVTPNELFYIRHHHPVPYVTEQQAREYRVKIDLTAYHAGGGGDDSNNNTNTNNDNTNVVSFALDDLRKLPKTEITVTLQCSGNRRGGYNAFQRTSGTPWGTYVLACVCAFCVRACVRACVPKSHILEAHKHAKHCCWCD
jgi:sulfite oxidase